MDAKHLSDLGRLYASHHNVSLATLSTKIANGGHVLKRIESGQATVTVKKYGKLLSWFKAHWPEDLEWPTHIPQPPQPDAGHAR